MPQRKFPKDVLREVISDDARESYCLERIENEIYDTSRWSNHYELIFRDTNGGHYWKTYYSVGATESQDEDPFEFEDGMIDCIQVEPVEVLVTQYVAVKD